MGWRGSHSPRDCYRRHDARNVRDDVVEASLVLKDLYTLSSLQSILNLNFKTPQEMNIFDTNSNLNRASSKIPHHIPFVFAWCITEYPYNKWIDCSSEPIICSIYTWDCACRAVTNGEESVSLLNISNLRGLDKQFYPGKRKKNWMGNADVMATGWRIVLSNRGDFWTWKRSWMEGQRNVKDRDLSALTWW